MGKDITEFKDNTTGHASHSGNEVQLTRLYELLQTFVDPDAENIDMDVAITTLDLEFPDASELGQLLMTYFDERVVFIDLVEEYSTGLETLILHLAKKCPEILQKPLEDEDASDNLLVLACSEKERFQPLYDLLQKSFPAKIAEADQTVKQRERAMKTLRAQLNKSINTSSTELFASIVAGADKLLLDEVIDEPFLEELLIPKHEIYLQHVIRALPILICRNLECRGNISLFRVVVSDPMIYRRTLLALKDELYDGLLSEGRHRDLMHALDVEHADSKKFTPALPIPLDAQQPLLSPFLSPEELAQFSQRLVGAPYQHVLFADSEILLPEINSQRLIESNILDALLWKLFRQPLLEKGIALMPTRRAIDTDRLTQANIEAIVRGEQNLHVVGVTVDPTISDDDKTMPDFGEFSAIQPGITEPIRQIMWPIHIADELHYGLFIYDIEKQKGYYIEPRRVDVVWEVLGSPPHQQAFEALLHVTRAKQMREGLEIPLGNLQYIFLQQMMGEVSCHDYVIAAVATIAKKEVNLNEPEWFQVLINKFLDTNLVKGIRLLEVQMAGEAYFNFQKPQVPAFSRTSIAPLELPIVEAMNDQQEFLSEELPMLAMDAFQLAEMLFSDEQISAETAGVECSIIPSSGLQEVSTNLPSPRFKEKRRRVSSPVSFWGPGAYDPSQLAELFDDLTEKITGANPPPQ